MAVYFGNKLFFLKIGKSIPSMAAGFLLLLTGASLVFAGDVNWKTERVYFKRDLLVIEGNFSNNTSEIVDKISEFRIRVKIFRNEVWRQISSATFASLDIFIRPGESKPYTFRLLDVEPQPLGKWKVSTWIEYHFLSRRGDERQKHSLDWD